MAVAPSEGSTSTATPPPLPPRRPAVAPPPSSAPPKAAQNPTAGRESRAADGGYHGQSLSFSTHKYHENKKLGRYRETTRSSVSSTSSS